MGQRNMQMLDLERDQDFILSEPCVIYGGIPNLPQPNIHTFVPGRRSNYDLHQLPEHHEGPLFFGMTPYHQYPATNLNLPLASQSNGYNPYLPTPSAPRDILVPVNHGAHDQSAFSSSLRMVGIPTDGYVRSDPYVDGVGGSFKRKIAEGFPWNPQYVDASAGSSSAVAPISNWSIESDATPTDAVPFMTPEYGANDIEGGTPRSIRNRSGIIGPDSVVAHNSNHLIQGNYVCHPFLLPGNPWLGLQLGSNSGDVNNATWSQPSTLPFVPGSINGGGMEAGNVGLQGYQMAPQGHPTAHQPPMSMQGVRGHNMNFNPLVAASSRRLPTNSTSLNSFQGILETGPRYVGPVPPAGFRFYQPHSREAAPEISTRHRSIPHLRVLPEDGVAIMEVAGYHESGYMTDQHRDLRMDIDHMSYEELLALGEQIGNVGTGLSEEAIASRLRVHPFASSDTCATTDEAPSVDHKLDFCVVCQGDYMHQEQIATLDCGHEYHIDCIKKWLIVKNACPICKSTALKAENKDL